MREILFRGKALEDEDFFNIRKGDWIFGNYSYDKLYDNYHIEDTAEEDIKSIQVDKNTIGQYTGLTDKNGTKIFEGDIVKILYTDWASKSENDTRTLEEYLDSLTKVGVVYWDNLSLCYHLKMKNECFSSIHCGKYGYIEVIGNIYDNPELLEVQND